MISTDIGCRWAVALLVGAATVVLLAAMWRVHTKRSKILEMVQGIDCVPHYTLHLLPEERGRHLKTPSISTVTFYQGKSPVTTLRKRIREVISANPFLASRLIGVTSADVRASDKCLGLTTGVTAVYPQAMADTAGDSDHFQLLRNDTLAAGMPYHELVRRVRKYNIPLGKDCVDKGVPLFKVTLFEIEKDAQYCMMVSLSHTIADGHTFYKVYAMLNPSSPVTSIVTKRVPRFSAETSENLNFGMSLRELPFTLLGTLCNRFLRPPMEARTYYVNTGAVQAEKDAFRACQNTTAGVTKSISDMSTLSDTSGTSDPKTVTFLSTNDVVTAWFLRFSRVTIAFMIANFRSRLPYLADNLGGNYQGRVLFTTEHMYQPATIRASLAKFKCPYGSKLSLSQIATLNLALVTNWASFYSDVQFSGTEQLVHLPVIDVGTSALRQCMVLFQARKGVTGVILWTRGIPQKRFDAEAMLEPAKL
jgi:hypothetical protein